MKIKKNDTVKILKGKDKGKTGKVTQVFPNEEKIVIDGINKRYKNLKSRRQGEKGQRIEFFAPMSYSNVAIICKKCGRPTRVGYKFSENKEKYRICRKCKESID
ncbi:MAG TPA: 50S ribosomal protein L24 [bacterium]|jgi:large subunit ribosomal protein L24|nr:50S ribosomal protein L24 [bacterium]HOG38079.1 50S ribosomal protein L24 [bacterium]HQI03135.1 50S ribosomal protein L24 [bacterium]